MELQEIYICPIILDMSHESTIGGLDANSKHFERSPRLRDKRRKKASLAEEEEKRRIKEAELSIREGWELIFEGMTPEERRHQQEQEKLGDENRDNIWDWDEVTEGYLTAEEQLEARKAQEAYNLETKAILAEERRRGRFYADAGGRNGRRRTQHARVAVGGNYL